MCVTLCGSWLSIVCSVCGSCVGPLCVSVALCVGSPCVSVPLCVGSLCAARALCAVHVVALSVRGLCVDALLCRSQSLHGSLIFVGLSVSVWLCDAPVRIGPRPLCS